MMSYGYPTLIFGVTLPPRRLPTHITRAGDHNLAVLAQMHVQHQQSQRYSYIMSVEDM